MKKRILSIILSAMLVLSLSVSVMAAENTFAAKSDLNGKTLTVSGSGVRNIKGIVTVKIDAPDGTVFNINQVKAEADGTFSYAVELLDTDATGTYTVTASVRESSQKQTDTEYYLSAETKLTIGTDLTSAVTLPQGEYTGEEAFEAAVTATADELDGYKAEFGIENYTDAEINNAADTLVWLNNNGYDFTAAKTVVNRSKTVWDGIASADVNTLTGLLKTNSDILFSDIAVYDLYNNFDGTNKRAVNTQILSDTYEDYTELRALIKSVVENVSATIQAKLINIQADININVITVNGNGIQTARKIVTVKITDPNGKIVNINQITANDDGTFTYLAALADDDVSGEYKAEVFSRAIDEIAVDNDGLIYMNAEGRDDVKDTVNTATVSSSIETELNNNKVEMGISELSAGDIKTASVVLIEQKPQNGYTYEEIINTINNSKALMDNVNASEWTSLASVIVANNEVLMKNVPSYAAFALLTKGEQNQKCQQILASAPFADITAFRTAFTNAMGTTTPVDPGTGPLGTLGGGLGGSGGGGGGGSSSAIDGVNQFATVPSGSQSQGFSDLTNHEWARESIEGLLNRGVVANASDGKFRPADNITREEFIKLLVSAFALTDANATCNFSDVPEDAWYYDYVASAYKHGITTGINETAFGAGMDIKRQEMAALVYRTVNTLGVQLSADGEEKVFNDAAQIADYSKEAISAMQKAGILNGDDTGNFRPNGSATRAEAAKVIYMLLVSTGR